MVVADASRGMHTDKSLFAMAMRKTRPHLLQLILSSLLLLLGDVSWAQSNDDANRCAAEAEQNEFDLATDHCTGAMQSGELSDQERALIFIRRGLAYHNNKDFDRAIQDYEQAMRLGVNDWTPFYRRGLVYLEQNNYGQAIQDFNQALKLNPDNVVVLERRGWASENRRDYDQAIRDYDRALSLQPNYGPAIVRRAGAYQENRQYEQALADYETATELDPKFTAERSKGFLFFYLGRMTRSAETFEKYMKSHPEDAAVILFRYLAEAKIGNPLTAVRELEADAAKLKERSWPAPIIDFHLGRIDEKAMFVAANDPDPKKRSEKTCAANFHAGEARLFRAQLTAAIALLRAAEKDCPSHLYEAHGASTELKRLGQKR
jgi:lipoprotein NlpI